MNKYSVTYAGILVSVAGTVLLHLGFSQACSNEIVSNSPLAVGSIIALWGRWRTGGVNWLGIKKFAVEVATNFETKPVEPPQV